MTTFCLLAYSRLNATTPRLVDSQAIPLFARQRARCGRVAALESATIQPPGNPWKQHHGAWGEAYDQIRAKSGRLAKVMEELHPFLGRPGCPIAFPHN
ncbi:MAG: hypothetical protein H0V35_08325 [Nitrospira sp.]|nr:hypothetical protein [Nitrospira sp.]